MIHRETLHEIVYTMQLAPGGYKTTVTIGGRVVDDDTAEDGVLRPGAAMVIEGIENSDTTDTKNTAIFIAYGEDELREFAQLCMRAANHLRRIESARRKRKATA